MENIKVQLLELLEAIDFNGDREEFATDFIGIVHQDVVSKLLLQLPKEEMEKIKDIEGSDEKQNELSHLLNQNVSAEQYNRMFEMSLKEKLKDAMSKVIPILDSQQLSILDNYLAG